MWNACYDHHACDSFLSIFKKKKKFKKTITGFL